MTHETQKAGSVVKPVNGLRRKRSKIPDQNKPRLTLKTSNGHDHWKELRDAVTEKDIMDLRKLLPDIQGCLLRGDLNHKELFDITENLDIAGFLDGWKEVKSDEISAYEALPRIHIHQHRRNSRENVHHFYEEQIAKPPSEVHDENETDPEWLSMEEALTEKDVLALRDTLRQIASAVTLTGMPERNIWNYLDGTLTQEELEAFEAEANQNKELQLEVKLMSELRKAAGESDIMTLRDHLFRIMQSQHSTSMGLHDIEAFLENRLDLSSREKFLEELSENKDLKSAVKLLKEVDNALNEQDVSALRQKLTQISGDLAQQKMKSIFPSPATRIKRTHIYAAVFIFLIGLSTLSWLFQLQGTRDYSKYFPSPVAISGFRSAPNTAETYLFKGLEQYDRLDYTSALTQFRLMLEIESNDPVAHFYAGASCQNLHKYHEALMHYLKVTEPGDNLFAEQAEWLQVFCLLQISENQKARKHLEAIIERKGFYSKDASNLLSGLKDR